MVGLGGDADMERHGGSDCCLRMVTHYVDDGGGVEDNDEAEVEVGRVGGGVLGWFQERE